MKQERIDRINTLYHKSQAVGLTEEEKKEQAALLMEKERLRANLLRTISHDLRTPLTAISGTFASHPDMIPDKQSLRIRRIN